MTIQEAIERANGGDVEAMVALGDYYSQEKAWSESLKWYETGAVQGSLYCIIQSMTLSSMSITAAKSLPDKDWMMESSEKCGKYANMLLMAISSHPEQFKPESIEQFRSDALAKLSDARFHLALGIYLGDKTPNGIARAVNELRLTDTSGNLAARILLGVILFEQRDLDESYQKLNILTSSLETLLFRELDLFTYTIYGRGYLALSLLCLHLNDTDMAHSVLENGVRALSGYAEIRELLTAELSKYRKKLFGGYEYIG